MKPFALLLVFVSAIVAQGAGATPVLDSGSWDLRVFANDVSAAGSGIDIEPFPGTIVPLSGSLLALNGAAQTDLAYSFTDAALSMSFAYDAGVGSGSSASGQATVSFNVTVPTSYTLTGDFLSEPDGGLLFADRTLIHSVTLVRLSDGMNLFFETLNQSGQDVDHTLGSGAFTGSVTGLLDPGDDYQLVYSFVAQSTDAALVAEGTGSLGLSFSAPVPEPATASLVLLGLLGLAATRSRRREAARG